MEQRSIDDPHETRPYKAHGHMDVVTLGDFTLGRGTFEPGWQWSNDVKPIAGTESCMVRHTGICISGTMTIRTDDGVETTISAGDVFVDRARTRRLDARRRTLHPVRHRRCRIRETDFLTAWRMILTRETLTTQRPRQPPMDPERRPTVMTQQIQVAVHLGGRDLARIRGSLMA